MLNIIPFVLFSASYDMDCEISTSASALNSTLALFKTHFTALNINNCTKF